VFESSSGSVVTVAPSNTDPSTRKLFGMNYTRDVQNFAANEAKTVKDIAKAVYGEKDNRGYAKAYQLCCQLVKRGKMERAGPGKFKAVANASTNTEIKQ